jgi:ectoine hydroxylase-related dioxygenase (phytanoyl-CoA dioxygenase family)
MNPESIETKAGRDYSKVIKALDDIGYTIIPSVISPEEADDARAVIESLLNKEQTENNRKNKTQRVGRIAVKHPVFRDLMCHPTITSLWEQWLGKDMICSTWTANTLYPGHSQIGWHADYPYWALELPWPTGSFTGQTIWMLDDFTEDNGATGVVPYSQHRLHPPDKADTWHDDARVLTGQRGSVAVLHGALWHTGLPNKTNASRSCLLGMYIRPHCMAMEDMRGQLEEIEEPSEIMKKIMGANQRQPSDVGC